MEWRNVPEYRGWDASHFQVRVPPVHISLLADRSVSHVDTTGRPASKSRLVSLRRRLSTHEGPNSKNDGGGGSLERKRPESELKGAQGACAQRQDQFHTSPVFQFYSRFDWTIYRIAEPCYGVATSDSVQDGCRGVSHSPLGTMVVPELAVASWRSADAAGIGQLDRGPRLWEPRTHRRGLHRVRVPR